MERFSSTSSPCAFYDTQPVPLFLQHVEQRPQPKTVQSISLVRRDGDMLVGSENNPGTWRNTGMTDYCYWERFSGFSGTFDAIIANDFTDNPSVVTMSASDEGFHADRDCGTWSLTN